MILINQLLHQALGVWEKIHPHRLKPPTLDYLIQSRDHIIVFWFEIGGQTKQPILISKIPRIEKFNYNIERSVKLVDNFRRNLKPHIKETIPFRVFAGRVNDLSHIVMGALPGEPIYIPADNILGRRAVERHLSAFLSWLIEFQSQTMVAHQTYNTQDWEEFFAQRRLNAISDFSQDDQYQLLSKEISDRLSTRTIPSGWGYGDAHHSNILIDGCRISGVIDWIGVQENQWFYIDWYYFLFSYALQFYKKNLKTDIDSQRKLGISTTMGITDHWLTGLFQGKTRQFLAHYSFTPDLSQELFLTFLHGLHWPNNKALLIQDAYQVYNSTIATRDPEI